ncbi:MAG TPA: DUF1028 domain-containing protein [Saprospiraceae bacterium]|nr:DUF1028 domain-containing protein [Saprospiraceae bacterium]HMP23561.1 DUF1028 domain-containing protein [Saprospiraceae bacterium]
MFEKTVALFLVLVNCFALPVAAQKTAVYGDQPLAHTFSITAYDAATGDMGVAVQSHWFSVGTIVAWGEAGVGVVATQSFVNPAFGPEGLALLQQGLSAEQALQQLVNADEGKDYRQVGIVDAQGRAAAFTGAKCIRAAGHYVGKSFSVQANMMLNETVWTAMAQAFETSADVPLAERLVRVLQAAQQAGGDIRGQQSAALLVVSKTATGQPWIDRKVDIRVDDHPDPIGELERLLRVHRAYEHMNRGDVAMENGQVDEALQAYQSAQQLFPNNLEMRFWYAVSLLNVQRTAAAQPVLKAIFGEDANWRALLRRLPEVGLLQMSAAELEKYLQNNQLAQKQ